MTMQPSLEFNADVWEKLYASGGNDLRYPNDFFVRLSGWHLSPGSHPRILDHGCGTGANLMHLASRGFEVAGSEVSPVALEKTRERLQAAELSADLRLIGAGETLPWRDRAFDAVVCWQVLSYGTRESWGRVIREIERVTRPGGICLIATVAPGDMSHLSGEPLGDSLYRSAVAGQEGCTLFIPEEEELPGLFPGRTITLGEFGFRLGDRVSRHWVIVYTIPGKDHRSLQ